VNFGGCFDVAVNRELVKWIPKTIALWFENLAAARQHVPHHDELHLLAPPAIHT
jgi:hypothetical protein